MNKLISRFCLLLAGSDLSESEIARLFNELRNRGLTQIMEEVSYLRSVADKRSLNRAENEELFSSPTVSADHSSAAGRIVALLRDEAHMSTREAVEELSLALLEKFPDLRKNDALPQLSKKSFDVWLEKLARIVPPRELLHLATVIRNRRVHQVSKDWTLKG